MRTLLVIALAAMLASCATGNQYTGDEYYYTKAGVYWSCREPRPYLGGNCKPESEWGDRYVAL